MYPPTIARERPDHLAYVMAASGATLTYAELDDASNRLAQRLRQAAVRIGDTLLIAMENRIEWPVAVAAGMRAGLYVTPVNSHLRAGELAALVAEAKPAAVLTSPVLAATVAAALGDATPLRLCVGEPADGFGSFDDELASAPAEPIADESFGARVLYSGGTTGRPRAFRQKLLGVHPADAPARHGGLMGQLGLDRDTVLLSPAPNYHAAPFTFQLAALTAGGTVVCLEKFGAAAAMAAIARHGVTLSQWVPTMLVRLLDRRAVGDIPLSPAHRAAVTSGGPCAPWIKAAIDDWWGPILHEYYGASEGYGHTYISPLEARERVGSVGRPLGETRLHIIDDDGAELAPGEVGSVWFEALGSQHYVNRDDEARTGPHPGWRSMSDLGTLDDDGYLYLKGRKGYTIVSGGVNIYPDEIEATLQSHPWVRDVAVLGEPNAEFGEQVLAVVELAAGAGEDVEATLIAHCREHLATFKAPKRVVVVDGLPRLPTGKLNKKALRDAMARPQETRMSATILPTTVTFDDLHALRIKGRASDEALGRMLGVSPGDAAVRRSALVSAGLAQYREGRRPASSLTPDGRELHSALLTERLTDIVRRSAVEQGLAGFLPVNGALKRVCSSWQIRADGSANTHDDAAYDAGVIGQLAAVHADATALLRSAARIEPRFGRYADRLDSALARVKAGDAAAFLRPMTESYHDIWMELHEDLILLAGKVRAEADEG